tara:strand:- start:2 stop:361 length:360 start_codon:yes stop_codon:yes gene_type:complete
MVDFNTGRPDHIEDYLVKVRRGQWFGWSDSKNKIYANLIVHDGGSKPTESDCVNGLQALQDAWALEWAGYRDARRKSYGKISDQLDQLYHDIDNGKLGADAKTGTWYLAVKEVKDANPK